MSSSKEVPINFANDIASYSKRIVFLRSAVQVQWRTIAYIGRFIASFASLLVVSRSASDRTLRIKSEGHTFPLAFATALARFWCFVFSFLFGRPSRTGGALQTKPSRTQRRQLGASLPHLVRATRHSRQLKRSFPSFEALISLPVGGSFFVRFIPKHSQKDVLLGNSIK